jgi:broad specificity phosphatase PhoE
MRGEIWLVRHGETTWSLAAKHTSRTDLPLTARGEQRAAQAGRLLGGRSFALVLASPMRRALDTCKLAGYRAEVAPDLREWDYGVYEGRTTAEIQADNPGWTIWTAPPPGGETAAEVGARADRVIARALAAGGDVRGDVVLFGHGHMLRVLAARWLGLEPAAGRLLALSTGSVSVLGYEHGTHVIQHWNRTPE